MECLRRANKGKQEEKSQEIMNRAGAELASQERNQLPEAKRSIQKE